MTKAISHPTYCATASTEKVCYPECYNETSPTALLQSMDVLTGQESFQACHKVFNITELLEMILLDVDDIKTVLLAQRVHKRFRGVIRGSVRLQDKLWLPSVLKKPSSDFLEDEEHPSGVDVNPLFKRIRSKQGRFLEIRQRSCLDLLPIDATFHQGAFFGTGRAGGQKRKRTPGCNDSWLRKGTQSWRSMLVAKFHPNAASEFDMTIHVKLSYVQRTTSFTVDKDTKVQDLVNFMRNQAKQWVEECQERSVKRRIAF